MPKVHLCFTCHTKFGSGGALAKHKLNAHPHGGRGPAAHLCVMCLARFVTVEELRAHMVDVHGAVNGAENDNETSSKFKCSKCTSSFKTSNALYNHIKRKHSRVHLRCPTCQTTFARKDNLKRHMKFAHTRRVTRAHVCHICRAAFPTHVELTQHFESAHDETEDFLLHEHALQKTAATYIKHLKSVYTFQELNTPEMRAHVHRLINAHLQQHPAVKTSVIVLAEFEILDLEGDVVKAAVLPLRSQAFTCLADPANNTKQKINTAFGQCQQRQQELATQGSGWTLKRVQSTLVEFLDFKSLNGGGPSKKRKCEESDEEEEEEEEEDEQDFPRRSVGGKQRTTASTTYGTQSSHDLTDIDGHKQLLNIESQNAVDPKMRNKCLLYVIAAYFIHQQLNHRERRDPAEYDTFIKENICTDGMQFPSGLKDIHRLVTANPKLSLRVNVFCMLNNGCFPLQTEIGKGENVINILLVRITSESNHEKGYGHYVLIRNVQTFLRTRYADLIHVGESASARTSKKGYRNGVFCIKCFSYFYKEKNLRVHKSVCRNTTSQCEILPEPDGNHFIKFENKHKKMRLPAAVYFDFEAYMDGMPEEEEKKPKRKKPKKKLCPSCATSRCKCETTSYTSIEQRHKCIMYAYTVVDCNNEVLCEKVKYCPKGDAAEQFIDELLDKEEWFDGILDNETPMHLSKEEEEAFQSATKCHICDVDFTVMDRKVRDHSHYTSEFRGAAHAKCNLTADRQRFIPVLAHNLSGYDANFLFQCMKKREEVRRFSCLPVNTAKFRCFSINRFRFMDSMSFLTASLSSLGEQLKTSNCDYKLLQQSELVLEDGKVNANKLSLLTRKGIFPYNFATCDSVMRSATSLPSRKEFYNTLSKEHVLEEDYMHAQDVWDEFGVKDMVAYMKLYCLTG